MINQIDIAAEKHWLLRPLTTMDWLGPGPDVLTGAMAGVPSSVAGLGASTDGALKR
ncbi:MAG TPA: hypothetical protein VFY84_04305 [Jiangellales bacterium]|nr:hypothetical protein [Jiangellales bacterium]